MVVDGGVIAAMQVVFAVAGIGAALLVLVLVTSIPLWLFSVLSSVIYVVLVPVARPPWPTLRDAVDRRRRPTARAGRRLRPPRQLHPIQWLRAASTRC